MKQKNSCNFLILCSFVFISMMGCQTDKTQDVDVNLKPIKLYQEAHRPQFHFSPPAQWMNDPNGMFYFEGKYHLFYQYYPDSTVWGPMHWGHAESADLVHWNHLPVALYPDSIGCIFSGGAVVDHKNTSNLGKEANPPIVATFTHHNFDGEKAKTNDFQQQSIAYSTDGGYEWQKYDGNPVIPNSEKIKDFRDPKVVWHKRSQQWILVLAAYDRVKFYSSPNLIDWTYLSDFGIEGDDRLWECPDLFPMKVDGTDDTKWVLIVSIQKKAPNDGTATSYFIGEFDGKEFKCAVEDQKWLDWGTDNYAFVTWDNVPVADGRKIGIGWMSNWQYAQIVPTDEWRSAMTIPRELKLVEEGTDYTLHTLPVREIEGLRSDSLVIEETEISEQLDLNPDFPASQCDLNFTIDLEKTTASTFGILLENELGESLRVEFDKKESKMNVDRTQSGRNKFSDAFYKNVHSAPIQFKSDKMKIRMLIDVSSIEIFVQDGAMSFTSIFFPSKMFDHLSFWADGGVCQLEATAMYTLDEIWNNH